MVLTKKLKFDVSITRMGNTQIALVGEIRLLGLTIDQRLTFTPHVAKACKKAANIYKGIARAAKATWGLSPEIVRTIYVIEPIVMYASYAWAPAARKLGVRKMLDALQRGIALKACRAYRMVSLYSTLILARLLPLDIRVRKAAKLCEVKRLKELGDICADRELERPVDFRELPHPVHTPEFGFESIEDLDPPTMDRLAIVGPHVYTDGSRIEGKVTRGYRGQRARWAASLDEWQQLYAEGSTGEITKSFFPRVDEACKVLSRVQMMPLLAQTLTGHGGFAKYLNRFKLKNSPYCACVPDKVQDLLHVLEERSIFAKERAETEAGTGGRIVRQGFPNLLNDYPNKELFLKLAVNNVQFLTNVLGIKDPKHKQKLALKAMDVVLFGPPKEPSCGQLGCSMKMGRLDR
ncbi:Putative 115 kDa protein in type-1 retrotransposable element R1DM [Eumeta japonica]|uniref:115 kDa protein in type-1 retrotransposable element R1DM n=1 Tax=Eumeta variegata TaxID=151549 RepID=A0A4C1W0K5_EUMVA|nr:Putative 115 kDa protein in type-1 retrotransposable element R1DM [Eumeta japonica]